MEKCNVHIVGSGLEYFADEKEWLEKIENFEMEVDEFLGDVIIDFVAFTLGITYPTNSPFASYRISVGYAIHRTPFM